MTIRTFIIAEAGVNHNGDIDIARKMVEAAVDAGADAIKFQTFKAELAISRTAKKADYQKTSVDDNQTQLEMIRCLELSEGDHSAIINHCKNANITFLSSPFDLYSIDLLANLGLETFKIPSGEIINLPYLRRIGEVAQKVILSTGMATLCEIEAAIDTLTEKGVALSNITLMHCNTAYPTPYSDVNLRVMDTIRGAFPETAIGFSDHTKGIEVPIAAVAMGATVLEKHFTMDREMSGPDHKISLEPKELRLLIRCIRNVEIALGSSKKSPTSSERRNIAAVRKSIVAATAIKKGEIFTKTNLTTKRPGYGISPMCWDELLGKTAEKDYEPDEMI